MTAPVASGWSDRRVGLAPTGKAPPYHGAHPWRAFQEWLEAGSREVTIPYAKVLARMVPPSAVRLRRDFGALLCLIRAHALLHQASRQADGNGRVVATSDDYRAVREIVADVVAEGVEATVPATIRDTVNATKALLDASKETVSQADLMKRLELDRGTVSRRVRAAKDRGYLKDLETGRGKPSKLTVDEPMPEDQPVLPQVDDLVLQCCGVAGGIETPSPSLENGGQFSIEDDPEERAAIQEWDGDG